MAVWDLNSNLDVFGMQTFLRGLIYVTWASSYNIDDRIDLSDPVLNFVILNNLNNNRLSSIQ
jgi:hypothetical protein